MLYSHISGYFHDFIEEQTMMLKVFPDCDLRSTTHDCKKEHEKDIHMTPTAMMLSISMLASPKRGNVFVLGADTSRVGIGSEEKTTLGQAAEISSTSAEPSRLLLTKLHDLHTVTGLLILPKPCGTPAYPSAKVSLPRNLLESFRLTKEKTGQKK
ncbi:hypothetical protein B296_00022414 [Ensete ventricosum]|uniref:Uncharacterized protein n=1 Tax=Ensete ventricosum TaxID=4639 RepID=A0A426XVA4_ENSVE|nr:hypothetical protein B296_00022414 [Ensete ventricosum]